MRVLILGAGGMLGHKVWQIFRDRFDCRAAVHTRLPMVMFDDERVIDGVDASDFGVVKDLIEKTRPAVVVNCIGVVKQLAAAHDPITSITLNSLFPHIVSRVCGEAGARMIHISTDCVFAGTRGDYNESDVPDAADLYGRSKLLGEVVTAERGGPPLTIRTSIVGRELRTSNGVVEWFLANRGGSVRGFTRAMFSGVTTTELARTLASLVEQHRDLEGLYHVAGAAISKYDLLVMLSEALGAEVVIAPDDSVVIDRTLDATRFRSATGIAPLSWPEMIAGLAAESPQYERWRTE
ncbi:MAG: SDR family oxidoreductase [Acidobacteriota bacterium]|nr:SDR family oxidoreductase [Acidobacteriota bacterium]